MVDGVLKHRDVHSFLADDLLEALAHLDAVASIFEGLVVEGVDAELVKLERTGNQFETFYTRQLDAAYSDFKILCVKAVSEQAVEAQPKTTATHPASKRIGECPSLGCHC